MDFDQRSSASESFSVVLQGDDNIVSKRALLRNSSVSYSSRVYYYRNAEGVPFQWEMQPGTPKKPPREEVLPPLSPSPAMINSGLPKPSIQVHPKASTRPKFGFWKKSKKNQTSKKLQGSEGSNITINGSGKFGSFDVMSSDCEFMSLPRNSSSSSSSSLCYSINPNSMQSSRLHSPARALTHRRHLSCSPWNISAIFVRLARRNS